MSKRRSEELAAEQARLLSLSRRFPDCDPEFLRFAISQYEASPSPSSSSRSSSGSLSALRRLSHASLGSESVEEKIASKIQQLRFYPTLGPEKRSRSTKELLNRRENEKEDGEEGWSGWDLEQDRKNGCLLGLMEAFPDADPMELRQLVEKARFHNVYYLAEQLLAKGYKAVARRIAPPPLDRRQMFRSKAYMLACKKQLSNNDFPSLWKSSVETVLLENNYDYPKSFEALQEISAKFQTTLSGRFFSAINWKRKKINLAERGLLDPDFERDLMFLEERAAKEQEQRDQAMALELNSQEYSEQGELLTCACCFGDFSFEELCQCGQGHLFCKECVSRYLKEQIFGEAGASFKELSCFSGQDCSSRFPPSQVHRALGNESDLLKKYYQKLSIKEVKEANMKVLSCPFCNYTEFIDSRQPEPPANPFSPYLGYILLWICGLLLCFSLPFYLLLPPYILFSFSLKHRLQKAITEANFRAAKRDKKGLLPMEFHCLNPECSLLSCTGCKCEAHAPYTCFDQQNPSYRAPKGLLGLRMTVETAMAEALFRTCPQCGLNFVKRDGCNKMVCTNCPSQGFSNPYPMCYICRQDLSTEGYKHFCPHFRTIPGSKCTQCTKCELYGASDDERLTKEAGMRALNSFLFTHPELRGLDYRKELPFLFQQQ